MISASSARPGFTLIELLVALVLFGLLAAAAATSQRTAALLLGAAGRRTVELDRIASAQATLRQLWETAGSARGASSGFAGAAQAVTWVGRRPAAAFDAGLYRLSLRIEQAEPASPFRLLLDWTPAHEQAQGQPPGSVILLDGIAAAALAYRGDRGGWRDAWAPADGMPALIRLDLRLEGAAASPPLVAAPGLVVLPAPAREALGT